MRWIRPLILLAVMLLAAGCLEEGEQASTPMPLPSNTPPATASVAAPTPTAATATARATAQPLPTATALPTAIRSLVSGPTPTARPLPTRVLGPPEPQEGESVVIVTRVVDESPPGAFQSPLDLVDSTAPEGQTAHFTFYVVQGGAAPPMEELGPKAEEIFDYVSRRLGASYDGQITVLFRRPATGPCPARGMAMPVLPEEEEGGPFITVFADEENSQDYVYGVLAHEVGHILHVFSDWQGGAGSGMGEGFAHWLSEPYVNEWYGSESYDELVRGYVTDGTYRPLHEQYNLPGQIYPGSDNAHCLELRDLFYTEWGSFVGFLADRYGKEELKNLMQSGGVERNGDESIVVPPDFQGVYGLALNQLEAQWLRELLDE